VAEIARDLGALTVAVVTRPFSFEGGQRKAIAERGFAELADKVDTIITINNDKLLQIIDKKTSLLEAFSVADDVLRQGVQGIAEIITIPGLINVDFADVRAVMANAGSALMGIGQASGENRAVEAAKAAINSSLLDMSIDGARGIIFTITGGPSLGMNEVSEAAKVITASADSEAKIIFGAVIDEKLKDEIKVTVVATGFDGQARDISGKQTRPVYTPNAFIAGKEEKTGHSWFGGKSDNQAEGARKSKISSVKMAQEELPDEEAEEGELGIPAFIRKKMK
jgi:cell division protein FtsZ